MSSNSKTKFLGCFSLAMLSVSAIISLRNLPTTALEGPRSIFFFVLAGLLFFIPVALACAELASGWPEKGGVFTWVKEAFGPNIGFLAIWLEWIESVVWLPTILSFMAATTAYLINPSLESNKYFLIGFMFLYLWGGTFINFFGIKLSSWISTVGVILGSLIPALVLIGLGFHHAFFSTHSNLLEFTPQNLIPESNLSGLVTFTAILLGLCGMEIPAYHVQDVKNPKRDYPRAMFLATFIILAISIFGSLAIAAVIPKNEISLVAGPMQTFTLFFKQMGLENISFILGICTLVGGVAILNTWIIGPSKGLLATATAGHLPPIFTKINKKEVPISLLLLQAFIASILIGLFIFNPSIKAAYWIVNTLAAQLYLIMYFILFLSLIRLRITHPNQPRAYQIPGGLIGVSIVGGTGALACLVCIGLGFIKPDNIVIAYSNLSYAAFLLMGIFIFILPPFIFTFFKNKSSH